MKRIRTIVIILSSAAITAFVLLIGFWLWLELYAPGCIVVEKSIWYDVSVPGKPKVSAKLYWLGSPRIGLTGHGGNAHLLVLKSKSSHKREFYYIDDNRQEVGLPNHPMYFPLFNIAVIDRSTIEGYPETGTCKTEWEKDDYGVRMRIMGFSDAAQKADPSLTPEEEVARELMPIAYQRVIVLTKTRDE